MILSPPPAAIPVPESCAESERVFARLIRYASDGAVGAALALMLSAVLWAVFFALRWVGRGFKSAT